MLADENGFVNRDASPRASSHADVDQRCAVFAHMLAAKSSRDADDRSAWLLAAAMRLDQREPVLIRQHSRSDRLDRARSGPPVGSKPPLAPQPAQLSGTAGAPGGK